MRTACVPSPSAEPATSFDSISPKPPPYPPPCLLLSHSLSCQTHQQFRFRQRCVGIDHVQLQRLWKEVIVLFFPRKAAHVPEQTHTSPSNTISGISAYTISGGSSSKNSFSSSSSKNSVSVAPTAIHAPRSCTRRRLASHPRSIDDAMCKLCPAQQQQQQWRRRRRRRQRASIPGETSLRRSASSLQLAVCRPRLCSGPRSIVLRVSRCCCCCRRRYFTAEIAAISYPDKQPPGLCASAWSCEDAGPCRGRPALEDSQDGGGCRFFLCVCACVCESSPPLLPLGSQSTPRDCSSSVPGEQLLDLVYP
jgi:hypothetical protein